MSRKLTNSEVRTIYQAAISLVLSVEDYQGTDVLTNPDTQDSFSKQFGHAFSVCERLFVENLHDPDLK